MSKVWERDWYEVHDLITDHGRFICGTYKVLHVKVKNFVKSFYAKELWLLLKPYLESLSLHSLVFSVLFRLSLIEYFCTQGSLTPYCRWASWADLFWIVLHDSCTLWWRWEVNVWPLGRAISLCVLYYIIMPLHYFVL